MNVVRAVAFVFCLIATSPARADSGIVEVRPTIESLEVLADRGEWNVVIFELPNVLPSQRGERFDALVERAALGYLATLSSDGMSGADAVAAQLLRTFPSLRRSARFLSERSALGLQAAETCYAATPDGDDCSERLFQFAKDDPQNLAFQLKAAALAHREQGGGAGLAFVELAVGEPNRRAACARPETRALILAGLSLPAGPAKDRAVALTANRCWEWMQTELAARVNGPASPHLVDGACAVYRAVGAILPGSGLCSRALSSKPR